MYAVDVTNALFGCLLGLLLGRSASQDVFSEELLTTWVSPRHLLVHFRFDQATTASRLHTSFPHAVQHLATTLPVHAIELELTTGRWDYEGWGWPLLPVKPVGAALSAVFKPGLSDRVLAGHWSALTHALSGLSCASLSLLRDPISVTDDRLDLRALRRAPAVGAEEDKQEGASERGRGLNVTEHSQSKEGRRLHALLPREALCTENLTPWLRLLPCRDQAGLASLLDNRPNVFGSEYISLRLLIDHGAMPDGRRGVRIVQTVTMVVHTNARPSHSTSAPLDLEVVLGAKVYHFCPAAFRSQFFLALQNATVCSSGFGSDTERAVCAGTGASSPQGSVRDQDPGRASTATEPTDDNRGLLLGPSLGDAPVASLPRLVMYDTLTQLETNGCGLRVELPSPPPSQGSSGQVQAGRVSWRPPAAQLSVLRFTTGAGLLRGGTVLVLRRSPELLRALEGNSCGVEAPAEGPAGADGRRLCLAHVVCVHQVFPWYVRPWVHTLAVLYDSQEVELRPHLVAYTVRPAVQRVSPGLLDLCLHVPGRVAEVQLRMEFSKAFLTAAEYPPDAHRGFDVPAAVVSYLDPRQGPGARWTAVGSDGRPGGEATERVSSPLLESLSKSALQQVYTSGLLVPLAAPDFSMPYNVICLSSTVLAVYFGALLNILTRRGAGEASDAKEPGNDRRGAWRVKALQLAVLVVALAFLSLYLDPDLRQQAEHYLAQLAKLLEGS